MILFDKSKRIEENVKAASNDPKLIKALDVSVFEEERMLAKLLEAEPSLYKLLEPKQMNEEAYLAMLADSPELFDKIPKKFRTEQVRLKALEADGGCVVLFEPEDLTYECVKWLYINEPYVLEELDNKKLKKAAKPHIKQLKKEKVVSLFKDEINLKDWPDVNDLPDQD